MEPHLRGYSYKDINYFYYCSEEKFNIDGQKEKKLVVRIEVTSCLEKIGLALEDIIRNTQTTVKKFVFSKDEFWIEDRKIPDNHTISNELIWLAENRYVPTYNKNLENIKFQKKSPSSLLLTDVSKIISGVHDWIMFIPMVIISSPLFLGAVVYDKIKRELDENVAKVGKRAIMDFEIIESSEYPQIENSAIEIDYVSTEPKESSRPNIPRKADETPNYKPFPLNSFKSILGFTGQVNLTGIIEKAGENLENQGEPGFLSKFALWLTGYNHESIKGRLLAKNASITSILFLLSSGFPCVIRDLSSFLSLRESVDNKGGFKKAYNDFLEIKAYFDQFYINGEKPEPYFNRLAISLLKDDSLFSFLKSENAIKPLADLIKSMGIPNFDEDKVSFLISLLSDIQVQFSSYCKTHPTHSQNPYELIGKIIGNDLRRSHEILGGLEKLVSQLLPLIEIFIAPNPYPIECLLNSPNVPHESYSLHALKYGFFKNCKKIFEKYSDKSLGIFGPLLVNIPLQNQINHRKLENLIFNDSTQKPFKNSDMKSKDIFTNIKEFAFEEFSFNNSQFHNFNFEVNYFKLCDFSDALFFGNITFKDVYMDAYTAHSFLIAIRRSMELPQCNLKTHGLEDIQIITSESKNEKIKMEKESSDNATVDSDDDSFGDIPIGSDDEQYLANEENLVPPDDSNSSTLYSMCKTVVNLPGKCLEIGKNYLINPSIIPEELYEDINSEKAEFEQAENSWNDFAKGLKKELEELKKDLANAKEDSVRTKNLEEQILIQQKKIGIIQEGLKAAEIQKKLKEKISAEQLHLLNHKNNQIKIYYQTLLSNLCGFLQVIGLTNNPNSIIKLKRGKATELANNVEKMKSINGEKTDKLATIWNMLCAAGDHIIGFADVTKSILSKLPAGSFITDTIDRAMDFSDKKKIHRTNKLFRGLTSKKLEKIADEIARKITFSYEEQISLLSEDGAVSLAECACQCIAGALLNGQLTNQDDIVTHSWLSVRILKTTHNANMPIFDIEIPWTNKSLTGKEKDISFTARDLYHNSGLAIIDGNKKALCSLATNEKVVFGYFHLKIEDCQAYFREEADLMITSLKKAGLNPTASGINNGFKDLENKNPSIRSSPKASENTSETPLKSYAKLGDNNSAHTHFLENERIDSLQKKYDILKVTVDALGLEILAAKVEAKNRLDGKEESHSSQRQEEKSPSKTHYPSNIQAAYMPQGIINLGTSCYMNAALQVMFNIQPICDAIKGAEIKVPNEKVDKLTFDGLLNVLFKKKMEFTKENLELLRLRYFTSAGLEMNALKAQQCSVEFLSHIMQIFNWKPMQMESRVFKNNKLVESKRSDEEAIIKIGVVGNKSFSIEEALQKYLNEASNMEVESKDQIIIIPCLEKKNIINEPEYIFIQLQRSSYQKNGDYSINNVEIQFTDNQIIKIPCGVEGNSRNLDYQIISIINHEGGNHLRNEGHYTAYIKNANGSWSCYNDDKVSKWDDLPSRTRSQSNLFVLKKMNKTI